MVVLCVLFPGCSRVVTVYVNNNTGPGPEIYQIMTRLCQKRKPKRLNASVYPLPISFLSSVLFCPLLSSPCFLRMLEGSPFGSNMALFDKQMECSMWRSYYSYNPLSSSSLPNLPGEVNRLLNMNGRREGEVHIPFNFCVLLSRWLNMIVLAVMYLIRGYFPSAQLTVPLCCSSGVHTASGHCSPLAYSQLLATHAQLQGSQTFENRTHQSLRILFGLQSFFFSCLIFALSLPLLTASCTLISSLLFLVLSSPLPSSTY